MNIREYQEKDLNQITALMLKFGHFLEEIDDMKRLKYIEGGEAFCTNSMIKDVTENNGKIFVIEDNGIIIGFVAGIIEKPDEESKITVSPGQAGRVIELYVDDNYRGSGIGKQLMAKIEDYLKSIGCDVVKVEVFGPNIKAHQFYNNIGYKERNYDLIKKTEG